MTAIACAGARDRDGYSPEPAGGAALCTWGWRTRSRAGVLASAARPPPLRSTPPCWTHDHDQDAGCQGKLVPVLDGKPEMWRRWVLAQPHRRSGWSKSLGRRLS
eukprot:622201-Rhodomonas_salina.1